MFQKVNKKTNNYTHYSIFRFSYSLFITNYSFIIIAITLLFAPTAVAQSNPVSVNNDVYAFLELLGTKGIVNHNYFQKPLLRMQIAKELKQAEIKSSLLTSLEKEQLEFYKKEYFDELNPLFNGRRVDILSPGESGRFRMLSYRDSSFTFNLEPMLGLQYTSVKDKFIRLRSNGLAAFGSVGSNITFKLSFLDNQEYGKYIDTSLAISPRSGHNITTTAKNEVQFDEVTANLCYSWKWGSVSIGKDYFKWGSGLNQQLILSDKAPSFPFIELNIRPTEWMRFGYIHGWLHSGLVDSSTIHYNAVKSRKSFTQREKYIASHYLSMDITKNFNFTLGESVIYSDKLQYIYLIPVMFFRGADHYMMKDSSNSGINGQVWANAYYNVPEIKSHFYGTVFFDELSLTDILKGGNLSAIGYTLGGVIYDPFIENSSITIEFTKISPFVYTNSNDAQHYSSYNYTLGAWMGSNAEQFYFAYSQYLLSRLNAKIFAEYTRKGTKESPDDQYKLPYPETLYGPNRKSLVSGFSVSYRLIHSLLFRIEYIHSNITDNLAGRTYSWQLGKNDSFSLRISYGID